MAGQIDLQTRFFRKSMGVCFESGIQIKVSAWLKGISLSQHNFPWRLLWKIMTGWVGGPILLFHFQLFIFILNLKTLSSLLRKPKKNFANILRRVFGREALNEGQIFQWSGGEGQKCGLCGADKETAVNSLCGLLQRNSPPRSSLNAPYPRGSPMKSFIRLERKWEKPMCRREGGPAVSGKLILQKDYPARQ